MADYPLIPGYGGDNPLYGGAVRQGGYMIPDEALKGGPQQKPKFNIGDFLLAWAGHLGDNLTGNPVYAKTQQARMDSEAEERERQRQKDWWYEQQRFRMENEPPDVPSIAKEVGWLQSLPPEERQAVMGMIGTLRPGMQAPVILPAGAKEEHGASSQPITATGPNGEKIRFNPQSGSWEPMGGPTAQPPSGGFPGY